MKLFIALFLVVAIISCTKTEDVRMICDCEKQDVLLPKDFRFVNPKCNEKNIALSFNESENNFNFYGTTYRNNDLNLMEDKPRQKTKIEFGKDTIKLVNNDIVIFTDIELNRINLELTLIQYEIGDDTGDKFLNPTWTGFIEGRNSLEKVYKYFSCRIVEGV